MVVKNFGDSSGYRLNKYNQLRFLVMILMPGMVVWYLYSILHKKVVQICSDIGNLV